MQYNTLERRCPRLGSMVCFEYCRTCGDENPCFKVFDCWWEHFDVVAYFRCRMDSDAFEQLSHSRPSNKVASLVELIREAQSRLEPPAARPKKDPST